MCSLRCWLHYSVWKRLSACLYSFAETAAGILTLPMFLLGSISQPHSSFSNTLALIGPHPHQLSLTTCSMVSSEKIQRYLVHRLVVWLACGFELHMWTAEPCVDTELIRGLLFLLLLPWWCLSVSLPTVLWRSGNNVAHQFAWGHGYNSPGPEAARQRSLSPSLARALSISFPLKFYLISPGPLFYSRGACRCIRCRYIWSFKHCWVTPNEPLGLPG